MSVRWAILFIELIAFIASTTADGLLRSARGQVLGFKQLGEAADKSGGFFTVMAFQQLPETQHRQPRDTSPFFRIWFQFNSNPNLQPKPITEIWFDWTREGESPSKSPRSGQILVLRSSTHPALVQKLTNLLTANTSSPDHPAYIRPPKDLTTLIEQCIALGKRPNRNTLQVGMVDCLDPNRLVNELDFYLIARADQDFLLMSQLGLLHLEYCEPSGMRLSAFHFNLLSDSIRMSQQVDKYRGEVWQPSVIGQEGFQLVNARTGQLRLYHRDRVFSRDVNPTNALQHCQWVCDCRPKDVERLDRIRGSALLTGLAVCSPTAWREEHKLPIDPELLLFGGEW
jgi:hypothetical protein